MLPLDGSLQARLATERPQTSKPRTRFVYYPGGSVVPTFAAPPIFNRPYSIEADVEIAERRTPRACWSPRAATPAGTRFYVDDGRLRYVYNYVGRDRSSWSRPSALPAGRHALRYEFEPTGEPDFTHGKGAPGRAQLYVDGELVANTEFPHTTPLLFELEGLSCGYDFGAPAAGGVRAAVRVHRHDPQRHVRRLGRADRGRRGRAGAPDGPAVTPRQRCSSARTRWMIGSVGQPSLPGCSSRRA